MSLSADATVAGGISCLFIAWTVKRKNHESPLEKLDTNNEKKKIIGPLLQNNLPT